MSRDVKMYIVGVTKERKAKELAASDNYLGVFKVIATDLQNQQVFDDNTEKIKTYFNSKNQEYSEYEIYNLDSLKAIKKILEKNIQRYKDQEQEVKEFLKAYYAGGKYNSEIEENLLDQLNTIQGCISEDDSDGNSWDYNQTSLLKEVNWIINGLDFYNRCFVNEDEIKDLYFVLEWSW